MEMFMIETTSRNKSGIEDSNYRRVMESNFFAFIVTSTQPQL